VASTSEELFEAIEADDTGRVRALLEADPSLARARDEHGVSALLRARYRLDPALLDAVRQHIAGLDVFEAAALGDTDRLRHLLDQDPALATSYAGDGFTPLHLAAFFGHPDAIELLLARGAEVDAFGRGWMTGTALHSAVSRARRAPVRLLLAAGANPNARQSAGWTPLHSAAHNGDGESVRLLLEHGADPSATNDEGRSVRDLAIEKGDATTTEEIEAALQAAP
jgi:ankyrin repeat protein